MAEKRKFFSEVRLDGYHLADIRLGQATLRERYLIKEFLDYTHMKKAFWRPINPDYPLVEPGTAAFL